MKNHFWTYFLLLGFLFCCKKDDPEKIGPCGVKDPVNELPWLKKQIQQFVTHPSYPMDSNVAIFSSFYQGERVFWIWSVSLIPIRSYKTCSGEQKYIPVFTPQDAETQNFLKLMQQVNVDCSLVIWGGDDFKRNYCKG